MLSQRPSCTNFSRVTRKQVGTLYHARPGRSVHVKAVEQLATPEAVQTGAYVAIGLGAASFFTTFFVLPKLYTRNTDWQTMLQELRQKQFRSISVQEAYSKSRSRSGPVLLDVRLPERFAEFAPENAVNVPLFLPIQEWDIPSIIRRIGFAFFGVAGTELNPNFIEQVQTTVPKGREIMVMCESGGSVEAKRGNSSGFQSRSLKAIYFLQQAGFTKLSHVEGGLSAWLREDLPVREGPEGRDGDDDDDDGDEAEIKVKLPVLSLAGLMKR